MGNTVPDKDKVVRSHNNPIRYVKQPKKGAVETGQVLDLHGLRLQPALTKLQQFVIKAFTQGDQVVMVVTGKGNHSKGGVGVIRREVEHWIVTHGRRFVRAYSEAPRAYGGRGAFLIYLREA
nr:Smr/MutS family protein [Acanthopleuribacter pedis]